MKIYLSNWNDRMMVFHSGFLHSMLMALFFKKNLDIILWFFCYTRWECNTSVFLSLQPLFPSVLPTATKKQTRIVSFLGTTTCDLRLWKNWLGIGKKCCSECDSKNNFCKKISNDFSTLNSMLTFIYKWPHPFNIFQKIHAISIIYLKCKLWSWKWRW